MDIQGINLGNSDNVGGYFIPVDPMDEEGMRCDSCE